LKCIFMDEDWRLKYFSLFSNNAYYEIWHSAQILWPVSNYYSAKYQLTY
jgi:hypothetical protein